MEMQLTMDEPDQWKDFPNEKPDTSNGWPVVMISWRWRGAYNSAFNHSNARYTDDGVFLVDEGELTFDASDAASWEIRWAPL
jgi:hypothetical protein